jgi:hypothetical protein
LSVNNLEELPTAKVTELLIVVGGRLQELPDVLRPQLGRLDAIR